MGNLIEVGEMYQGINDTVGSNLPLCKIYRSKGLMTHLIKQRHLSCIKHIDDISDIINNPDYIGINPNEDGDTIELIKIFDKNILLGIKLSEDEDYLYISTMYELQQNKLERRLHSGRILKVSVDNEQIDEV